ncbi:MAG: creatininase family protein [Gemmatimonadota bacterium]
MPVHRFAEMTWEEVRDADLGRAVAILPVGAVEAHGPHLPLGTDVVIAEGMARSCGHALSDAGRTAFILPPMWYTAAAFARAFPGTVSVAPDTVRATVTQIAEALGAQEIGILAIANAHLDPVHLASLQEAAGVAAPPSSARIVFLDLTRRHVAERLTDEFRTGACHAGRFEGSIVLAEAPEQVRSGIAAKLEPVPASLSDAIREGKRSFEEAGGERAYFGWPADATAEEGRASVETLGSLLAALVLEAEE